jgi:polyphosphate kinase
VRETYGRSIETLVMPLVADPAHPFPHVRNLRPALAAIVRTPEGAEQFVAIELPGDLPRFVPLAGGRRFVLLEDVIEARCRSCIPAWRSCARTRSASRAARTWTWRRAARHAAGSSRRRSRAGRSRRWSASRSSTPCRPHMRHHLLREFQYELEDQLSTPGEQDVYTVGRLVDLAALAELADIDMPELKFRRCSGARRSTRSAASSSRSRERDRLFHFPHDDFEASVERFLHEAAVDPDVVSIKVTLYRTSRTRGRRGAARGARPGKEVAALVELKASFDEQRNIEWARELEQDGIRVVFSPVRFKVHAKIALVVRREGDELRRYAYIGTGNLNARRRAPTSISACSRRSRAGPRGRRRVQPAHRLLRRRRDRRLLVAPFDMRRACCAHRARDAHARAGRTPHPRAAERPRRPPPHRRALPRVAAGVRIEMMVREICALRPGVPGVSENISVVSVVGGCCSTRASSTSTTAARRVLHRLGRLAAAQPVGARRGRHADPDPAHHALLDDATLNDPDAWELTPDGEFVPPGAA